MRPRLAYILSACFHLGLMWLIGVADDSWAPNFAVRSGTSAPAVSQSARARSTPTIDSRFQAERPPEPVTVAMVSESHTSPKIPPATPLEDADQRLVLGPPLEELVRRRTDRSVSVAVLPKAEFVAEVRPLTAPEMDGRAVPLLDWGPIPEPHLPTTEVDSAVTPVVERTPAPSQPVTEPGIAERNAIGVNTPAGAQTDHNPQKLPNNPEPVYPEELRRQRIGGTVLLRVAIRSDGLVDSANVEKSSGQPALDAAARDAVLRWRFTPARRAGFPVRMEVRIPITFSIRSR